MTKYKEILKNWERFEQLIEDPIVDKDNLPATLMKRYLDHNIEILNEVLLSSIDHLQRLQKTQSLNDVVCVQARLSDEISKKIAHSAQQFFSASLNNVSDYNEWLKAHCDFATD